MLELAKIKSVSPEPQTPSLRQPRLLQAALTSIPGSALGSGILTLEQLREKKKPGSTVPNNFVFSSKGTITYESLDLPDFVNGFLEFQKEQPDACTSSLTKHLQLLMARASTYNWSSVRSFHLLNRLPRQSTKADFRGLTVTRFVKDQKVNIFHASRLTNAPTHIGHATKSKHAAATVTKIQPRQEGEIMP